MPALQTYQYRTITGPISVVVLATKGGAVLGGIWVTSKSATGSIAAYDTGSATPTINKFISSVLSLPKGRTSFGDVETGTGLVVTVKSVVGCIFWRPSSTGI